MFFKNLRAVLLFAAAAQQIRNLNHPGIEHARDHWHKSRR
jgi:hypothetical protein